MIIIITIISDQTSTTPMNQSKPVAIVDDLQLEIKRNDAYACPVDLNPAYEKV